MGKGHGREGAWSVAEAKANLSKVIAEAQVTPQIIESRGTEVACVLGAETFERLSAQAAAASKRARWLAFLEQSKAIGADGGHDLALPAREARPSPFETRRKR